MSIERARALGIEPCPMCGSGDVRWRTPRAYDVVFGWGRGAVEGLLATAGIGRYRPNDRVAVRLYPHHFEHEKPAHDETAAGPGSARLLRCRSCGASGRYLRLPEEIAAS